MKHEVAYICDGYARCALEPGCYMRNDPVCPSDILCRHTTDPDHAKNGICKNPWKHPERFTSFPEFEKLKYYERLPGEEL